MKIRFLAFAGGVSVTIRTNLKQGVNSIHQLLLFPFHLFSLTHFLLLCFIVGEEVADYDTLQ